MHIYFNKRYSLLFAFPGTVISIIQTVVSLCRLRCFVKEDTGNFSAGELLTLGKRQNLYLYRFQEGGFGFGGLPFVSRSCRTDQYYPNIFSRFHIYCGD